VKLRWHCANGRKARRSRNSRAATAWERVRFHDFDSPRQPVQKHVEMQEGTPIRPANDVKREDRGEIKEDEAADI
jgi:hypothetical protein